MNTKERLVATFTGTVRKMSHTLCWLLLTCIDKVHCSSYRVYRRHIQMNSGKIIHSNDDNTRAMQDLQTLQQRPWFDTNLCFERGNADSADAIINTRYYFPSAPIRSHKPCYFCLFFIFFPPLSRGVQARPVLLTLVLWRAISLSTPP